jgi:predicted enzyme related to lactoylglutathione lyase
VVHPFGEERGSDVTASDEIAARVRAHGGSLDSEPFDAYGVRAFRLRDPDGFRFTISSPCGA